MLNAIAEARRNKCGHRSTNPTHFITAILALLALTPTAVNEAHAQQWRRVGTVDNSTVTATAVCNWKSTGDIECLTGSPRISGGAMVLGGTSPDASALLDVTSTTKGFLPPRMTTGQRDLIATPASGLTLYNTTTNSLDVRIGSSWISFGQNQTGNTIISGWPDAVTCFNGDGEPWVYMTGGEVGGSVDIIYKAIWDTTSGQVLQFSKSTRDITTAPSGTTGCTVGTSVDSLISAGRGFNFIGGATAAAAGAAGQVQFYAGGNLQADAGLTWDNANKRLGIGTTAPGSFLQINSTRGGTDALRLYETTQAASARFYFTTPLGSGPDLNISSDRIFLNGLVVASSVGANGGAADFTLANGNNNVTVGPAGTITLQSSSANTILFRSGVNQNTVIRPYSSSYNIQLAPSGGNVGIGTTGPNSLFEVASTGYAQFSKTFAGAPTAADCDAAAEAGRVTYDTTNNYWYVCEGTGGWVNASGSGGSGPFTDAGTDSYTTDDIAIGQSAVPETSAALEVESTTKGFLPPRMTTTQRNAIAGPVAGLIIYNTTNSAVEFYDGTTWSKIAGTTTATSGGGTPAYLLAGNNGYNALGPTNTAVGGTTNVLAEVALGHTFSSFSTGMLRNYSVNWTCGIESGTNLGFCWGYNGQGMVGDGTTTTPRTTPTAVSGGYTWTKISAKGAYQVCGIRTNNAAYCWGHNVTGAVGDGTTTSPRSSPTLVLGGYSWSDIRAGGGYSGSTLGLTCGVTTTGVGYCWGYNGYNGIGDGTTTQRTSPTAVSGGYTWTTIAPGGFHACGITTGNTAYCWGWNTSGQVGDGTIVQKTTPTLVSGGYSWASLDVGYQHTCGITTDGKMYCWGDNSQGELGNGAATTVDRNTPTLVYGGKRWIKVTVGDYTTCGITTQNALYCWGRSAQGQFGNLDTAISTIPVLILDSVTDAEQSGYHLMVQVD